MRTGGQLTVILALKAITALLVAGCAPNATNGTQRGHGPLTGGGESGEQASWPFWPTDMRIHPASRLVIEEDTGQAFIEARIEFTDAPGDTSKAVGLMTFDLLIAGLPANVSNPVLSWELPLQTVEENAQHYDGVTRTYLFRLSMGEWSSSPDVTLVASFESVDGERFNASQRFR